MSERGSTGASSRKTTLPLSSWRSFPTIEKLSSARTIAQEMNATALRMGALFRHDDVKHQPARGEQHDTRRCQHAGFHEQRRIEHVVIAGHIEQKRRNSQRRRRSLPRPDQSRTTRWLSLASESSASGLPKRSWVRISQIRTLSVERIGRRLARASEEEVDRVVEGLNEIIG